MDNLGVVESLEEACSCSFLGSQVVLVLLYVYVMVALENIHHDFYLASFYTLVVGLYCSFFLLMYYKTSNHIQEYDHNPDLLVIQYYYYIYQV